MSNPYKGIEFLRAAKIVAEDWNHGYILAWYGGHGIHAYDLTGEEVAFWNVGDFDSGDADEGVIEENIKEHILSGAYMDLMERS